MHINVSEVAGLIGYHKYRPQNEEIEKYRRKYNHDYEYSDKLIEEKILLDNELSKLSKKLSLSNPGKLDDNIEKIESNINSNEEPTLRKISDLMENSGLDKETKKEIVSSNLCRVYGTKNEINGFELYKRLYDSRVVESKGCRKLVIDPNITLLGRIDGIIRNKKIIEIKNRKNQIFHFLPEYEKVQITLYMKMFGLNRCDFIQCHGKTHDVKTYEFDEEYYEEIINLLIQIVNEQIL